MTRENILEAMNGIGEHLIAEAAEKLGFLNQAPITRKPKKQSAFSRFMNSGWGVAAVCALVAVSVMGGIIWAGHEAGHQPPVETPEESTVPPEAENESEIKFQFPLTDGNDTSSYVSITNSENKTVEFLVAKRGSIYGELSSVLTFATPKNGEANMQIVAYRTETSYGFVYMYESVVKGDLLTGEGEKITVTMTGYQLRFDKAGNVFFTPEPNTRTCHFTGNEERTVTLAQYRYNEAMLDRVRNIRDAYNDLGPCEYTILYRYVDGVETVNTPVESIPDFPFTLFNSYNRLDPES